MKTVTVNLWYLWPWLHFIAIFLPNAVSWVKSGPVKHKCQVQPQVKMSMSPLLCPAASTHATNSLTKSIDFPKTNYPASGISLTSSRRQGDSLTLITHQCWTLRTISSVYPQPQPFASSTSIATRL